MKPYCTQNNGNCWTCSLVSYGRDCQNTPVPKFPIAIYRVFESDLEGWTVETLTEALMEPLATIGVDVEPHPREAGAVPALIIVADMLPAKEERLRASVRETLEKVVVEGA